MLAAVQAVGGRMATLLLIATVVVSDSAQFYSGRLFGRRPLAPAISPKKTIEGRRRRLVMATGFIDARRPGAASLAQAALSLALLGVAIMVVLGSAATCSSRGSSASPASRTAPRSIPGHGGDPGSHRRAAVCHARVLPVPAGLT